MKIIDCTQGEPEWFAARLGVATASNFDRIITPTGKASRQAEDYLNSLLAEEMQGIPETIEQTEWMQRGIELEAEARTEYELITGSDVQQVGFMLCDGYGCSPDGLVGDDGMVEIKAPKPKTHVAYIREGGLPAKYKPQVQGQLWVAGRQWCDFISHCPATDQFIVRVERDEEFIEALAKNVSAFLDKLRKERARLIDMGRIRVKEAA